MDLTSLCETDLESECPYISILRIQKLDIDFLGQELSLSLQGFGTQNSLNPRKLGWVQSPRPLWTEVKKELFLLLCTKDAKYAALRRKMSAQAGSTTSTFVSVLSAAIAAQIGVIAGMVTPLVALALYGVLKLTLNAWCNIQRESFGPS
jgi:hypothetical protein